MKKTIPILYKTKSANWKTSRYNSFVLDDKKETILGYNFLYRSVIQFPIELHLQHKGLLAYLSGKISIIDLTELKPEWLETLKSMHFIVSEELDEISLIKFQYNRNLYNSDNLRLTILPTLWCNLDCPYCFEFKKPDFMSIEIEDALVRWIEANFPNKRHIHVSWFGGEPLLAKETIIRLSRRIKDFTNRIHATYTASMVTNGYYFDREFQKLLPELNLHNIQITLDGDQEDHDHFRRGRNGKGSFDTIYQNIIDFAEINDTDAQLTIRVNCTDKNYRGIPKLLERFPENVKKKTQIFFRWVWPNEASGYKEFAEQLSSEEPFKPIYDAYEKSNHSGWVTKNPNNDYTCGYCEVDYLDQFNVDPRGNLYLCTHTFHESESIGSVLDGKNYIRPDTHSFYSQWYAANPFDDLECVACKLLPVCFGGCRKYRVNGNKQCPDEKRSINLHTKNIITEKLSRNSSR